ncbi:hypothetical protein SprV_0502010200 [Sparganum proliferum]
MDDFNVLEILRDFSLAPHLLVERRLMIHDLGATVFEDHSRDRARSKSLPSRELLHGPDGFVERRRGVEFCAVLHLMQLVDGGVGYSGETVEDALQ